ncbi:hypothetical protein [Streptomyces drozdowiczii]|uniref:Secreted protein n=1 Tax=Streptomyces drozdowiczii TaxID=202862 RepID=A0ABY6Q288_9ACTN|nr:hypothetical protein [Streptomyces drozdowiczii]MCX0245753.1 hypothetical protein [Streptomyces drozdowiczii]UZK58732.1 hypothetical protein NEH16_11290 [Streptomyces drozdowiczii]
MLAASGGMSRTWCDHSPTATRRVRASTLLAVATTVVSAFGRGGACVACQGRAGAGTSAGGLVCVIVSGSLRGRR